MRQFNNTLRLKTCEQEPNPRITEVVDDSSIEDDEEGRVTTTQAAAMLFDDDDEVIDTHRQAIVQETRPSINKADKKP